MPRATFEGLTALREQPAYPLHEAAKLARVAPATLRTWVLGRNYRTSAGSRHWPRLITPADSRHCILSFNNLVEAHVLRALRTIHGSEVRQIRAALKYAASELEIDRLLLSEQLETNGGDIFLRKLGSLINLSRSGQLALKEMLEKHLQRVLRDSSGFPIKLYPFVREDGGQARVIAIDPAIGFGRPIVASKAISTQTIVDRIDSGEAPEALAEDYGLHLSEITEAVVYERAA